MYIKYSAQFLTGPDKLIVVISVIILVWEKAL